MEVKKLLTLKVKDSIHVYEARRLTAAAASSIGFSVSDIGRISIIVSEMITNLVKHSNLKDSTFIAQWKLERYPGLMRKSLTIIAAVFYRDFQRENDDLTIILVENN